MRLKNILSLIITIVLVQMCVLPAFATGLGNTDAVFEDEIEFFDPDRMNRFDDVTLTEYDPNNPSMEAEMARRAHLHRIWAASFEGMDATKYLLWESTDKVPGYDAEMGGVIGGQVPAVWVMPPLGDTPKGAILVFAGGSFNVKSYTEGRMVAERFRELGFVTVIVDYRIKDYTQTESIIDSQRAIRFVRYHAEEFGINPDQIAIMGFSAGGMCSMPASLLPDQYTLDPDDPIDQVSCKANAMISSYSLTNASYFEGSDIPVFLWVTAEDKSICSRNITLASTLATLNIPYELHIFQKGIHGMSLGKGVDLLGEPNEHIANWPILATKFLEKYGFAREYNVLIKSELETLVFAARKLQKANYSTGSWQGFLSTLRDAIGALEGEDVTQDAIDTAYEGLQDSMGALVSIMPVITSVEVTTPTIVESLAANLRVNVEGENLEGKTLTAYFKANGELLYKTTVINGTCFMRVTAAPEPGIYELAVVGDGYDGSCEIKVVAYNTNVWQANARVDDGRLLVTFNDDIALKNGTGCVTIENSIFNAKVLDDNRTVEVNAVPASGTAVIVKGVKYPVLFPSYSFTFTVAVP